MIARLQLEEVRLDVLLFLLRSKILLTEENKGGALLS
jgi:hypothetical protein